MNHNLQSSGRDDHLYGQNLSKTVAAQYMEAEVTFIL